MYQTLRLAIAAIAIVFASFPSNAPAQVAATQIMLTEKHIEGFIAVQKDMSELIEKMQGVGFSDPVNVYKAKLTASTEKRGFKNLAEYEAVAANGSGID